MSLVGKIFAAFIVMIAIAIGAGVIGWRTVQSLVGTLDRIVNYEMIAEVDLAAIEQTTQALTVAQRTLLNTDLAPDAREDQHRLMLEQKQAALAALAEMDAVFTAGLSRVSGWDKIQAEWKSIRAGLDEWMRAVDENETTLRQYEATTILAPDTLQGDIQRYRGDHFQLVSRLAEMLAKEESIGPKIGPADNLCAFGIWRERVQAGLEPYSANENIRKALELSQAPHKLFHASASRLQELISSGYEKNAEEIDSLFVEHIDSARDTVGIFQQIGEEVENARHLYRQAADFTMGPMREMREKGITALHSLVGANKANMEVNIAAAASEGHAGERNMQILSIAALVIGVLVMIGLFIAIQRGLSRPLSRIIGVLAEDSGKVFAEAGEVEKSSSELSQDASSQSASLEETSAAIEEITSMAKKNLDNAKAANEEMQTASQQIQESARDMELMSEAMGEIKESSEKISNILRTIEDIAFQTNLLALNAAVEAARAGEAGKGFAVVADEVRNLAGRSAQAVKDTSELITGTVARVNNGDVLTRRLKEHFGGIAGSTERITKMIGEIDGATSEQTLGMEQINQAVSQIDQINQKNAGNAEGNATASGNLNQLSGDLMGQIDELSHVLQAIIGSRGVPSGPQGGTPKALPKRKTTLALPPPRK